MRFEKYDGNPVIPRIDGTFRSIHVANPDLLEFKGRTFLYYRGQGDEKHDQIGLAWTNPSDFDGVEWKHYNGNPVIKVSKDRDSFDSRHILDPGSAVIDGKVFLYYSGHSYDKPACIGLAVSEDGFAFTKRVKPVIENAIAPEAVVKDGLVHLIYQRKLKDHFEVYKCTSKDGIYFDMKNEEKIMVPSSGEFSTSTCRIWQEADAYYMIYGMSHKYDDYPEAFGMAKSTNLTDWVKYPDNPVLERGEPGSWDEGAMWFGTVYKHDGTYYLWYEGTGSNGVDSDNCRNNDYGGYATTSFSQIGLATLRTSLPTW